MKRGGEGWARGRAPEGGWGERRGERAGERGGREAGREGG